MRKAEKIKVLTNISIEEVQVLATQLIPQGLWCVINCKSTNPYELHIYRKN